MVPLNQREAGKSRRKGRHGVKHGAVNTMTGLACQARRRAEETCEEHMI